MCAIVDTNVANEVFGPSPPPAGEKFLNWINKGSGRLVVGGELLEELVSGTPDFRKWAAMAVNSAKMRIENKGRVDARTEELRDEQTLKSNDPHVIALAQLSGARLLYSNDVDLNDDFRNKSLINNPEGRVYSTDEENNPNKEFRAVHRNLLRRNDLCRVE